MASAALDFSLFGGAETLPPDHQKEQFQDESRATPSPSLSPTSESYPDSPPYHKHDPRHWHPATVDKLDPHDWLWLQTEEPHRSRRKAILAAHPEIRKLMGHEPLTKYIVLAVLSLQLSAVYFFRNTHPLSLSFIVTAYVVGGTANQNLFLAIHEITHNLAFRSIKANKLLAIFANLPIGIPYAMLFKDYHIEHHKSLGEDGIDTDIPSWVELAVLRNVAGKAFFATFQIFFYALRPGFIKAQKLTPWHILNITVQLVFDFILIRTLGWYSYFYLIISSFFAGSLHPCAAHFIAEHYLFENIAQETWSYYGPLNVLCYNVGYHNEHHDFCNIPWTRLEAVRQLAPEFYNSLPCHDSWPMVTYRFIFEESTGLFARIKRKPSSQSSPSPQSVNKEE